MKRTISDDASPKVVSLRRGAPAVSDLTLKLVEDLRQQVLAALRARLDLMFDGADDLLFDFAERATNNNDRRLFFDTMRTVRLGRDALLGEFETAMSASFAGTPLPPRAPAPRPDHDDDEITLQNTEALELDIAVSNMSAKAEGLYKQTLWEIGSRLQPLIAYEQAPIGLEALTPATLCKAFRRSAETLDIDFAVELVIFKLFDRLVIGELGELYAGVLQVLKQRGIRAQPASLGVSAARAEAPAAEMRKADRAGNGRRQYSAADGEGHAVAILPPGLAAAMMQAPKLDAQTLRWLQKLLTEAASAASADDAGLAAALAATAQGRADSHWPQRQATACVQRASLVGHMFNGLLDDPQLPPELHARLDGLRLAAIKVALADLAFLADAEHPVRGLINELALLATTVRASSGEAQRRLAGLIAEIRQQFDIALGPTSAALEVELIDAELAERFLQQQLAQGAARRQAMVKKVRRVIAEELQLRTRGIVVDESLRPLLHSAWAPMMAMRLLQHGAGSAAWQQGMETLEQILHALDPQQVEARGETERRVLGAQLRRDFRAAGLDAARVDAALSGFERALQAVPPPRAANDTLQTAPAAADSGAGFGELLDLLIVPGNWFLIHDPARGEPRWLKAVAYYAGLDCAAFAEFSGSNTLLLKASVLLEDLAAGRTLPLELGPAAQRALDRFLAGSGKRPAACAA